MVCVKWQVPSKTEKNKMRYRYVAQTTVLDLSARGESLIVKREERASIGHSRLIMHVLYRDNACCLCHLLVVFRQ